MAKPEWGTKRTCTSCGAKFYDFQKKPIICPKCQAEHRPQVLLKPKRTPATAPTKPVRKPVVEEKAVEKQEIVVEEEDDAAIDDADDGVVLDDEVALTGLSKEAEYEEGGEEDDGVAGNGDATVSNAEPSGADDLDGERSAK